MNAKKRVFGTYVFFIWPIEFLKYHDKVSQHFFYFICELIIENKLKRGAKTVLIKRFQIYRKIA